MDNTQDDWKNKLTPEQYHVMREQGTEPAFTGKYWNDHSKGMYKCAACGAELFSSDAKFDSGTGWPSFTEPANLEHVELRDDSVFDEGDAGLSNVTGDDDDVLGHGRD